MHQSEKLGLDGLLGSIPSWSASALNFTFLDKNNNSIKVRLITKISIGGMLFFIITKTNGLMCNI